MQSTSQSIRQSITFTAASTSIIILLLLQMENTHQNG